MLELKNVSKTYRTKNGVTRRALNDVSLSFPESGLVFIVGRSGGGKSTLLNMIATLDTPDRGDILLYGNSFTKFTRAQLDSYRNTYVGVVFQEYNLIPTLTLRQNTALALGLQSKQDDERVTRALEYLGLTDIADRKPNEISGGQAQRAAIARAIVKDPKMIVADEPTGNLDSKTGREVFSIFKELSKTKLVIIVTHDRDIADEIGDRVIEIKDGRIHKDLIRTTELYEPAIDTVGDRLVRVPHGKKLDDQALEEINAILGRSERDTYIINESDTVKVKSMNIHVKNAVELRQEGNSTYYFPYRPEPETQKPIDLIGSHMPFSVGLKLSLSMLKHKKFRLVMTVIMLVLALFLAAVVGVFRFYDADRAMAKTMTSDDRESVLICKDGTYYAEKEFTNEDLDTLSVSVGSVTKVYFGISSIVFKDTGKSYKPTENDTFKNFYGLLPSDENVLKAEDLETGSLPASYGDAVVSAVAAQYMLDVNAYKGVNSYADLIGKTFVYAGCTFKICGIKKADLTLYYKADLMRKNAGYLYSELPEDYEDSLATGDGFVYVTENYIEELISETHTIAASADCISGTRTMRISAVADSAYAKNVVYNDGEGGFIIDTALYSKLFPGAGTDTEAIKEKLGQFNRENNGYLIIQAKDSSTKGSKTSLPVNGMHISAVCEGVASVLYLRTEEYISFIKDALPVYNVLVPQKDSVSGNIRLLKQLRAVGAHPDTKYYKDYQTYIGTLGLFTKTLTDILVMISVVAVLLLFSFISSSVKLEGRQIGILRGMGARGIDAFKAFGIEGGLITGASLITAMILVVILFPVINALISADYSYHFYSLVINPGTLLLMAITAVLITAAAITIPLIRLVTMSPVSAMNKNETQR